MCVHKHAALLFGRPYLIFILLYTPGDMTLPALYMAACPGIRVCLARLATAQALLALTTLCDRVLQPVQVCSGSEQVRHSLRMQEFVARSRVALAVRTHSDFSGQTLRLMRSCCALSRLLCAPTALRASRPELQARLTY